MALAPIALFVYNRPEHTRRTLVTLHACPELASSQLYVYCDGAKSAAAAGAVAETRCVVRELAPAATMVERDDNFGLARSIITGTTELCDRHGKVIVVEDDLDVAPDFLRFLNAGLDRYGDDECVMQVSGYQFPVTPPFESPMFLALPTSWGWATWARAWRHFDPDAAGYAALEADASLRRRFDVDDSYPYFDMLRRQRRGRVDSWAIRWYLSIFMRDGLTLYPAHSLVRNTGFDGTGTHGSPRYADVLTTERLGALALPEVALDADAQRRVSSFLANQTARTKTRRLQHLLSPRTYAERLLVEAKRRMPARARHLVGRLIGRPIGGAPPAEQDLDVYWDPKLAALLETWGEGNAWNEIQLLLANVTGSVVDIACGTGKVMSILAAYPNLEVHGFDISDFLIGKAIDRGLAPGRLRIADATKSGYDDAAFDYGYSIGSLEHFTEQGITEFLRETRRITRVSCFHQIPTSRSGRDHGWIKTLQSYHNNSVGWWLERFHSAYTNVRVLDSAWHDKISVGKWFVCSNT